jgi:hypothetical protein
VKGHAVHKDINNALFFPLSIEIFYPRIQDHHIELNVSEK